jgi:ABC-type branched-subunit amino acid transport system substrate-binding protein
MIGVLICAKSWLRVWSILLMTLLMLLPACAAPRPTIKIALVAPFEGRFREVGYDAFPAMRLALREQMRAGGIGNYQVEFVAYNDNADATMAERVAHDVVIDNDVVAVIGHFRADTTLAAMRVYTEAQLALLAPQVPADQLPAHPLVFRMAPASTALSAALDKCPVEGETSGTHGLQPFKAAGEVMTDVLGLLPDWQSSAVPRLLGPMTDGLCFATDAPYPRDLPVAAQALAAFQDVSGGFMPAPRSISTYDATRALLCAIENDIQAHGQPTRAGVAQALRQALQQAPYEGVLGRISFDEQNRWAAAPVWVYQYDANGVARMVNDRGKTTS